MTTQVTFTLLTTPDRFTTWLENHTQAAYTKAGGWFGGYSLQPARRMVRTDKRNIWRMAAVSEDADDIEDAISFEIEDLDQGRIKVTAECIFGEPSLVYKYFMGVLVDIGDEWSEAREGINRAFGVTDEIPQPTPASNADGGMTMGEVIELEEAVRHGDQDAAKRLDDEARAMGCASWAEYKTKEFAPIMREIAQAIGKIDKDLSLDDPINQAILARLRQVEHDPILGAIRNIPVKQYRQAVIERLKEPIDLQPTPSAALGDGLGEQAIALLQRIYDHFVTHGEWPRYYDLEIEMHDVAPLYEIISGIDESLLLYEWPIQESSICFLTLKGIEKCNGSERDIQNFLRATDLFARWYIRDRVTATINNHDLVSELGMSESEAHRACKLILQNGGVLREGASSSGDGRWHEFRASRKALHFKGVSTLEDYFKRETRAWEAEKSEADRAMRPVRAHGSRPTDHRAMLRQNLVDHFNREELRTLCFDLGIEHENLPDAKEGLARELVVHCQRRGIITDLVAKCRELRLNVSWEGEYE